MPAFLVTSIQSSRHATAGYIHRGHPIVSRLIFLVAIPTHPSSADFGTAVSRGGLVYSLAPFPASRQPNGIESSGADLISTAAHPISTTYVYVSEQVFFAANDVHTWERVFKHTPEINSPPPPTLRCSIVRYVRDDVSEAGCGRRAGPVAELMPVLK